MAKEDGDVFDLLSSVPSQLKRWTVDFPFADTVNNQFDTASQGLRHTLESATWLPDSMRPRPPKPPPRLFRFPQAPRGYVGATWQWLIDYRAFVCPVAAFFGTGAFRYYRRRKLYGKKRRAKRTNRGVKTELVVVAGSTHSPHTRSIILDLERRGFVVYVATSNANEESIVKEERKQDILALHVDVNDVRDVENSLAHFSQLLREPPRSSPGNKCRWLSFAGLIIVPDVTYPAGPVETISPELWSDALNAKVLDTIATARAFTHLLAAHQSRLIITTPSIISAIRPAFQSVESTIVGALDGFTDSYRSELATLGVPLCQLRLGTFDCSSVGSRQSIARDSEQEVFSWPAHARDAYASNYLKQEGGWTGTRGRMHTFGRSGAGRGSPLRELNNAVFDALTVARPPGTQRVGQGSTLYAAVGAIAPASLVRWMMGIRPVQPSDMQHRRQSDAATWEKVGSEV